MDTLTLPLIRALGLIAAVGVLYTPLAWLERWAGLPPGERERVLRRPFLPLTHAFKLVAKRSALPAGADRLLHVLAPFFAVLPGLIVLAQLPPAPSVASDTGAVSLAVMADGGNLVIALAFLLTAPLGLALAGWAGGNHLALLGGLRMMLVRSSAVAVVLIGCAGVARAYSTVNIAALVLAQAKPLVSQLPAWGALTNVFGFGTTMVALAVLSQRGARSQPDQNIDLVEGHAVTAAGPTLLAHRVGEVVDLLAFAALLTSVFLGGWSVPVLDADITAAGAPLDVVLTRAGVFGLKTLLSTAVILAIRRALPPLRHDQALRLVWTVLVPLAMVGFVLTSVLVYTRQ